MEGDDRGQDHPDVRPPMGVIRSPDQSDSQLHIVTLSVCEKTSVIATQNERDHSFLPLPGHLTIQSTRPAVT